VNGRVHVPLITSGAINNKKQGTSLPMPDLLAINALQRPGLAAVSFSIAASHCVAVTGASGSGKSLLLRAIADLDDNQGEVWLDGQRRLDMPAPAWRQQVGYVPAESGWWRENVGDHFEDADAAVGLLHRLQMPAECLKWPVARLSTGERQRLALARALILAPRVLLLDEPTSGLDSETTLRVEAILHEKLAGGSAILLVSHDAAQANRMASIHYRMVAGQLQMGVN
jgi:ABC-type iron transport system FetAB ATPase subunit